MVLLRAWRFAKMVTKCRTKENSPHRYGESVGDNFVDDCVAISIDTEFDVPLPFMEGTDVCFEG